jgi:cytochrome c551/c552
MFGAPLVVAVASILLLPSAACAQPPATDLLAQGSMMGGGMMGGAMMNRSADAQDSPASVDPARADALLAYIRERHLSCTQCHSIAGNGFGPSFAVVSANYANRADAAAILQDHIANGYRRMPGGLVSGAESASLAKMILGLVPPR